MSNAHDTLRGTSLLLIGMGAVIAFIGVYTDSFWIAIIGVFVGMMAWALVDGSREMKIIAFVTTSLTIFVWVVARPLVDHVCHGGELQYLDDVMIYTITKSDDVNEFYLGVAFLAIALALRLRGRTEKSL